MERDGSEMTCVGARAVQTEQNRKEHSETRQGELSTGASFLRRCCPFSTAGPSDLRTVRKLAIQGFAVFPDRQTVRIASGKAHTNCAKSPKSKPPTELYSIDTQRSRYLETTSSDLLVVLMRRQRHPELAYHHLDSTCSAHRRVMARGANQRTSSRNAYARTECF